MSYFGIVSLFNGLLALFIGLFAFVKNRRNPVYLSFSTFAVTVALWSIFYAIWQWQTNKPSALFYVRLTMAPCYYIPFAFTWFVLTLIEEDVWKKYFPLGVGVPTFFLLFSFNPLMVQDVVARLSFPFWPVPGFLMNVYVFIFFWVLAAAFYLLFRSWFKSSGIRRWQLRWITLTTLSMWMGGSTNWFLWYNIPVPPITNVFVGIFFLLLAYGVVRRQLFDVDTLADYIHEAKLTTLGTLAASLLHEIRNPLFVAQGFAESLLTNVRTGSLNCLSQGERDKKCEEKLNKVINQISRVVEISERFLEFARPNVTGHQLEEVNLNAIVENVLYLTSYTIEFDKIKLEKQIKADTCLYVDRRHLEEILLNLITNACQAMTQGGGLKISEERQNGCIQINISDTGEGIPPDKIKRIFDPFFSTKKEKGMGLGLYIVKKLVERNGGRIKVLSEIGMGSKFILEFPVARPDSIPN